MHLKSVEGMRIPQVLCVWRTEYFPLKLGAQLQFSKPTNRSGFQDIPASAPVALSLSPNRSGSRDIPASAQVVLSLTEPLI
ncbi:hypothetical protein FKM82_030088 [Ascaphus truei]